MDKRTFLKLSAGLLAGAALPRAASGVQAGAERNWAGNVEYGTASIHEPETRDEVRAVVARLTRLRPLGTRHSFSLVADSTAHLVSLRRLDHVIALDEAARTVTVEAGIRYGELSRHLHERGFALHNLASLPHISVAGACATATHGSGVENGNLATAVVAMELVTAGGDVIDLSPARDGERFDAAVVALGGLGVVTQLTLRIEPTFDVAQEVYRDLPLANLRSHFDEIMASGYSVSLFTDWRGPAVNQVWRKRRVTGGASAAPEPELFGARLADGPLHPIAELSAENCTEQMGVAGPWHDRLPHFRLDFTPSSGEELQSEYFVPRERAVEALVAIHELSAHVSPHLLISEVRAIAADTLWMSPCYEQPSVAIHFTWKPDWAAVAKVLPLIEERLAPLGVRPHWGKLFTISASQLAERYERLADFRELLLSHDPQGKFRNEFLQTTVLGLT